MPRPILPVRQRGLRSAETLRRRLNALARQQTARERTPPGPLPRLEPIPAQTGVADWEPDLPAS
jgi:hypothetical protein